jgi:hypothetical protein
MSAWVCSIIYLKGEVRYLRTFPGEKNKNTHREKNKNTHREKNKLRKSTLN